MAACTTAPPVSTSDQRSASRVIVRPLPEVARPVQHDIEITGQTLPEHPGGQSNTPVNGTTTARSSSLSGWQSIELGLDNDGRALYLDHYAGKVVVVAYWASWCPPCWSELAQLQDLYGEYKHKGVEVVAVNLGETKYAIDRYLTRQPKKLTYRLVMDQGSRLSRRKGAGFPPVTDLYDQRGQRVKRYTGFTGFSADDLRRRFNQML